MLALEPGKPIDPNVGELTYLTPPNLVVQFRGLGDGSARWVFSKFVSALSSGALNPDDDFRQANILALGRLLHKVQELN